MNKIILFVGLVAVAIFFVFTSAETKDESITKSIDTIAPIIVKETKVDTIKKSSMPTAFASCVACHGKTGEKKALNKSKILADMSKKEIIAALNGYINNTYGGSMKAIMTSQAKKLSKEEIEDIAAYIEDSK